MPGPSVTLEGGSTMTTTPTTDLPRVVLRCTPAEVAR